MSNKVMRRQISSIWTTIFKWTVLPLAVFSVVWFIFIGTAVLSQQKDIAYAILQGISLAIFIICLLFICRWFWRLKKVEIDENNLYISQNYIVIRKQIVVPIENILCAYQSSFTGRPPTIIVEFEKPTEFGNKISFNSAYRLPPLHEDPIVKELNDLAAAKKS